MPLGTQRASSHCTRSSAGSTEIQPLMFGVDPDHEECSWFLVPSASPGLASAAAEVSPFRPFYIKVYFNIVFVISIPIDQSSIFSLSESPLALTLTNQSQRKKTARATAGLNESHKCLLIQPKSVRPWRNKDGVTACYQFLLINHRSCRCLNHYSSLSFVK